MTKTVTERSKNNGTRTETTQSVAEILEADSVKSRRCPPRHPPVDELCPDVETAKARIKGIGRVQPRLSILFRREDRARTVRDGLFRNLFESSFPDLNYVRYSDGPGSSSSGPSGDVRAWMPDFGHTGG